MSGRVLVEPVDLVADVAAWFTGRAIGPAPGCDAIGPGQPGNLAHRRPHRPAQLARDRADAWDQMGLAPSQLHWMRQVHGATVGVVGPSTPPGAELRDVDALVTHEPGRALVVQSADCVPVLLAAPTGPIAAVHAGRRGVEAGLVGAALDAMEMAPGVVHAAVGPAIGGCCYEVPESVQAAVTRTHPQARATTTWGTASLDLPGAVVCDLERRGVARIVRAGGCTRCDPEGRWFSHRADPHGAGRQVGVIVRPGPAQGQGSTGGEATR